ncbi:RNA-binding protein, putative [Leishmania tarentolae]|uniref:RNA-binding protein, putative n=1 Tax=Leishmania tarentolae TaxID=5689 RepID=A0A640KL20_LEITA|nr:RNA-binding protein, putative [Leishmania tarentolae]
MCCAARSPLAPLRRLLEENEGDVAHLTGQARVVSVVAGHCRSRVAMQGNVVDGSKLGEDLAQMSCRHVERDVTNEELAYLSASVTARGAVVLALCPLDGDGTTVELTPVESRHGRAGLLVGAVAHKGSAKALASVDISHEREGHDCAVLLKQLAHIILCHGGSQLSHKEVCLAARPFRVQGNRLVRWRGRRNGRGGVAVAKRYHRYILQGGAKRQRRRRCDDSWRRHLRRGSGDKVHFFFFMKPILSVRLLLSLSVCAVARRLRYVKGMGVKGTEERDLKIRRGGCVSR